MGNAANIARAVVWIESALDELARLKDQHPDFTDAYVVLQTIRDKLERIQALHLPD